MLTPPWVCACQGAKGCLRTPRRCSSQAGKFRLAGNKMLADPPHQGEQAQRGGGLSSMVRSGAAVRLPVEAAQQAAAGPDAQLGARGAVRLRGGQAAA